MQLFMPYFFLHELTCEDEAACILELHFRDKSTFVEMILTEIIFSIPDDFTSYVIENN